MSATPSRPLLGSEQDAPITGSPESPQFRPGLPAQQVEAALLKSLRVLARAERNAVLWFDEIRRRHLYRRFDCSSIYHYARTRLGFSDAKTAQFVSLCKALEELPALRTSLSNGEVSWTKARVVAKVATPHTEKDWVQAAKSQSRRQLESRATEARRRAKRVGQSQVSLSLPAHSPPVAAASDGKDGINRRASSGGPSFPEARPAEASLATVEAGEVPMGEIPVTLRFRVSPEQYARYQALMEAWRKKHKKEKREDLILAGLEALVEEAAAKVGRGAGGRSGTQEQPQAASAARPVRAPSHQVVVRLCPQCEQAHVSKAGAAMRGADADAGVGAGAGAGAHGGDGSSGAGAEMSPGVGAKEHAGNLSPATLRAILCDTKISVPGKPNRSTIPPAMRRAALERDGHTCRVRGCGATHFLEVHHLVARSKGGKHEPANLITLCSACHRLIHEHVGVGDLIRNAGPPD